MPISLLTHSTFDIDEAQQLLKDKNLSFRLSDGEDRSSFHYKLNWLYGENSYLAETSYGLGLELAAPAEAIDYMVSLPVGSHFLNALTGNGDMEQVSGLVHSPTRPFQIEMPARIRRRSVSIKPDGLKKHLARLTGSPVVGDIVFDAKIERGRGINRAVRAAMSLIADEDRLAMYDPLSHMRVFEENFFSILLLYQPHSHRELLRKTSPLAGTADIKRAMDYMSANLSLPMTLKALIDVANVPGRTLNEHFRAFTGLSPMAYLRRERLKRARQILMDEADATVTDTALRCGFTHLGRFAASYAEAFGESPSATLQETRRNKRIRPLGGQG